MAKLKFISASIEEHSYEYEKRSFEAKVLLLILFKALSENMTTVKTKGN